MSLSGKFEALLTNSTPGLWKALKDEGTPTQPFETNACGQNSASGEWLVLIQTCPVCWPISIDIKYEQLENLGGKVAVHHFSSKHDLDHLEDQDEDET